MKNIVSKILISTTFFGTLFNFSSQAKWDITKYHPFKNTSQIRDIYSHLVNNVFSCNPDTLSLSEKKLLNYDTEYEIYKTIFERRCQGKLKPDKSLSHDEKFSIKLYHEPSSYSDQLKRANYMLKIDETDKIAKKGILSYEDMLKYVSDKKTKGKWACFAWSIYLADYLNKKGFLSAFLVVDNHMMVVSALIMNGKTVPILLDANLAENKLIEKYGLKVDFKSKDKEDPQIFDDFFTYLWDERARCYGKQLIDYIKSPERKGDGIVIDADLKTKLASKITFSRNLLKIKEKGYYDLKDFLFKNFNNYVMKHMIPQEESILNECLNNLSLRKENQDETVKAIANRLREIASDMGYRERGLGEKIWNIANTLEGKDGKKVTPTG